MWGVKVAAIASSCAVSNGSGAGETQIFEQSVSLTGSLVPGGAVIGAIQVNGIDIVGESFKGRNLPSRVGAGFGADGFSNAVKACPCLKNSAFGKRVEHPLGQQLRQFRSVYARGIPQIKRHT
jgi:hypothetical protein